MRFSMIAGDLLALGARQAAVEPGIELVDRQMQRVQDEIGGLVEGASTCRGRRPDPRP